MNERRSSTHRLPRLRLTVFAGALGTALTVAACGGSASTQPVGSGATGEPTAAAGDVTTGEAAGVRFVSQRFHYRIDAPGTVTEAANGTATASRGVEQLTIRIVTGSSAGSPVTFAQGDVAALPGTTSNYALVTPPGTASLAGRSVYKVVFASSGTNAVTGAAETLVNARYYIARDSATLAVVTYSIVASQYDPQGADDVVTTFQWQ
jgi:hypothetical protein